MATFLMDTATDLVYSLHIAYVITVPKINEFED